MVRFLFLYLVTEKPTDWLIGYNTQRVGETGGQQGTTAHFAPGTLS